MDDLVDRRAPNRLSRRRFLGTVGAGAAGAATLGPASLAEAAGAPPGAGGQGVSGRFGRIFPSERPFAADSPQLQAALLEIGRPGGMLDANDYLTRGPIDLLIDPALRVNNPDNLTHTAGTTFMGQFFDHDMTFDTTSPLGRRAEPRATMHLGPVGGRIVAEVILGLMQTDDDSFLASQPRWRPTLPASAGGGDFRMVDLLTLAGVDPISRAG